MKRLRKFILCFLLLVFLLPQNISASELAPLTIKAGVDEDQIIQAENTDVESDIQEDVEVENLDLVLIEGKYFFQNAFTQEIFTRNELKDKILYLNGKYFYINEDNSVPMGWVEVDNKVYFQDQNGLARGWKEVDGGLRYFSPKDFRKYKNGVFSTGEGVYLFDYYGIVIEGNRPSGSKGHKVKWFLPKAEEIDNSWSQENPDHWKYRNQEIANTAEFYQGRKYKWYGIDLRDKSGVYCCGATYSAYELNGIKIPGPDDCDIRAESGYAMVRAQWEKAADYGGKNIETDSYDELLPGDIIFYSKNPGKIYNHVGLYMGKNNGRHMFVHATGVNGVCTDVISDWSLTRHFNRHKFIGYVRYEDLNK